MDCEVNEERVFVLSMNLLLFETEELRIFLPTEDLRVKHIRDVLKMSTGDEFYVGVINGPRGKARIIEDNTNGVVFEVEWDSEIQKPLPITLIVGLPRPQIGRRILEDATTMGVARILFFAAEKGEASYISSKLWQTDEWRRHLIKGAEQAFSTTIPEVVHFQTLADCLEFLKKEYGEAASGADKVCSIALDNYEATSSLSESLEVVDYHEVMYRIAIGPERGWSSNERNILREAGFVLAHLGKRVLKMETACVAALSLTASKLGG